MQLLILRRFLIKSYTVEHGENYKQETNSNVQFLMHFQPQLCDLNAILCF